MLLAGGVLVGFLNMMVVCVVGLLMERMPPHGEAEAHIGQLLCIRRLIVQLLVTINITMVGFGVAALNRAHRSGRPPGSETTPAQLP